MRAPPLSYNVGTRAQHGGVVRDSLEAARIGSSCLSGLGGVELEGGAGCKKEFWEREGEPGRRGKRALSGMAAGGEKGKLSPGQGTLGLSQMCPPAPRSAPRSCPVGIGDSRMSTVEPRRVWPHLSCSWEVIGSYSSTGTQ